MTEKEYEGGCDPRIGFLFHCTKKHVNQPVPLSADEIAALPAWCGNEDDIFIQCKACDQPMIYTEGPENRLEGRWACPGCDRVVREITPYRILEAKARAFAEEDPDGWNL